MVRLVLSVNDGSNRRQGPRVCGAVPGGSGHIDVLAGVKVMTANQAT